MISRVLSLALLLFSVASSERHAASTSSSAAAASSIENQRAVAAAVREKTLKLTRQYILAQYDAFATGALTFRILKGHLAKATQLPEKALVNGGLLGDALDDEVEAITQRCDTGKRAKETCVVPSATNAHWELSEETRAASGLDSSSVEAVEMRAQMAAKREQKEAAARSAAAGGSSAAEDGHLPPLQSLVDGALDQWGALQVVAIIVAVALALLGTVALSSMGLRSDELGVKKSKLRGKRAIAHRQRMRKLAAADARRAERGKAKHALREVKVE